MGMVFRYSEQVERYHFGKKSDIHFQLSNERVQLTKQQSLSTNEPTNFFNKSKKKKLQRSSTTMDYCLRHENFYCNAKKLSIFDDAKCNVVILGTKDSIKIYKCKSQYSDILSLEPDAIIPYDQINMIKFSKSLKKISNTNKKQPLTFVMNPQIETTQSQNYTFRYSEQHIVSATLLETMSTYSKKKLELSDADDNSFDSNNHPHHPPKRRKSKKNNCILGLWCHSIGSKHKKKPAANKDSYKNNQESYMMLSQNENENSSKSKVHLNTITKECCFQTRLPVHNIDLNTAELFHQSGSAPNLEQITTIGEFTPAKPQALTHTIMGIYVNPDFHVNNPKNASSLNLYDLRFLIPSYSAILLRRFIDSSYCHISKNSLKRIETSKRLNTFPIATVSKYKDLCREELVDEELCVPPIDIRSRIMTSELYISISDYLPPSSTYQKLVLLYSSDVHGTSLKTLYTKCQEREEYGILLIKENTGNVFGAIISKLPKISKYYYGNGSSSVFRYEPKIQFIKNFKWSGLNSYIIKGDTDSIWIGGGKSGASIWLNEDLIHGRTQISETFLNEQLSDNEHFESTMVELWTFEPM